MKPNAKGNAMSKALSKKKGKIWSAEGVMDHEFNEFRKKEKSKIKRGM